MSAEIARLESEALRLPLRERARLAESLLASLDTPEDAEAESLWAEEATRRADAFEAGRLSARPAADVFRDARAGRP